MDCEHEEFRKVEVKNDIGDLVNIIYQCKDCHEALDLLEYQNLMTERCKNCYGKGWNLEVGRVIPCGCRNLRNYI